MITFEAKVIKILCRSYKSLCRVFSAFYPFSLCTYCISLYLDIRTIYVSGFLSSQFVQSEVKTTTKQKTSKPQNRINLFDNHIHWLADRSNAHICCTCTFRVYACVCVVNYVVKCVCFYICIMTDRCLFCCVWLNFLRIILLVLCILTKKLSAIKAYKNHALGHVYVFTRRKKCNSSNRQFISRVNLVFV